MATASSTSKKIYHFTEEEVEEDHLPTQEDQPTSEEKPKGLGDEKPQKRRGLRKVSRTGVRDPADIIPRTKKYSRKNQLQRRKSIPFVYTPLPSPVPSPGSSPAHLMKPQG